MQKVNISHTIVESEHIPHLIFHSSKIKNLYTKHFENKNLLECLLRYLIGVLTNHDTENTFFK